MRSEECDKTKFPARIFHPQLFIVSVLLPSAVIIPGQPSYGESDTCDHWHTIGFFLRSLRTFDTAMSWIPYLIDVSPTIIFNRLMAAASILETNDVYQIYASRAEILDPPDSFFISAQTENAPDLFICIWLCRDSNKSIDKVGRQAIICDNVGSSNDSFFSETYKEQNLQQCMPAIIPERWRYWQTMVTMRSN